MPIYEYQCSSCKKIKEELNKLDTQMHSSGCLDCLQPMYKIISAPHGVVVGSNTPVRITLDRDHK